MTIGLILLAATIGLIVYANVTNSQDYLQYVWYAIIVPAIVITVVWLVVAIAWGIGSLGIYSKLQAFDQVKQFYTESITSTADAVVQLDSQELSVENIAALVNIGVRVENLKHSTLTATRILEARDYQREMTEKKAFYRLVNKYWILRQFIAKPPEGLLK